MGQTWDVHPRRLLPALLAVVLLAGAGCGGSDDAAAPAAKVPAGAVLYAEAVIQPDGELRDDAEAALRKALGTDDPSAEIAKIADELLGRKIDLRKDVQPWLGERAAVALTRLNGRDAKGLALIETTDGDAALETVRQGKPVTTKKAGDVEYGVTKDGDASVVVDGVLLTGDEQAVRAAIGVQDEDRSLAAQRRYQLAREDAGADGALGFVYADLEALLRGASAAADDAQSVAAATAVGSLGLESLGISLLADADRLSARGAVRSREGLPHGDGDGARALAGAPAGSIFAVGLGDVGGSVEAIFERFGGLIGAGLETVLEDVRRETGLDVRKDVLGWMGDATFYVRGSSIADIGGALVVQTKDPARSKAALPKIAGLVRGQGIELVRADVAGTDIAFRLRGGLPLVLAQSGDRVVLALGEAGVREALKPAGRLGDDERFERAVGLLGDGIEPTLFVDPAAIGSLVGAFGGPGGEKTQRVLQRFGALVGGVKYEGPVDRFELLVPLQG